MKKLIILIIVILIIVWVFAKTSAAQELPAGLISPVLAKPDVAKPPKFDTTVFRRQRAILIKNQFVPVINMFASTVYSTDVVLNLGPFQMVSRVSARIPGQGPYYPTWGRPQICYLGFCPTFSGRKDRITGRYSFKIGFKKQF